MRLNLTADDLLTTTRSVRKRLDLERPVPLDLVRECIQIAVQAPTGSNRQGWHWMVVTDPAKRAGLAELYRRAFATYAASPGMKGETTKHDPARHSVQDRVRDSAHYLAEHLHEVPVLVIPCIRGRVEQRPPAGIASSWGSLFPATWSFMLAARERGLGTCWTTLHLTYEQEAAEILGIPYAEYSQGLLTPVAYTKGTDFRPAPRLDLDPIIHVDRW